MKKNWETIPENLKLKCFEAILLTNKYSPRLVRRFFRYTNIKSAECWVWIGFKTKDGYGKLSVNGVAQSTHRISFELFNGKIKDNGVVRHSCDNPACVNPEHLLVGTQLDNIKDRVTRGRNGDLKGIKNGRSKLTVEQVLKIRVSDLSQRELAKFYNVSQRIIGRVINYQSWKHI